MKDAYEVLRQKEADIARVRNEIESLRIVSSLLSDELTSDEPTKKTARTAEKTLDHGPGSKATGRDGVLFSGAGSRSGLWKI